MVQRVIGPDGVPVDFPEGMSDADMTAAMAKHFPKVTVQSTTNGGVPLPEGTSPVASVPQTSDQGLGLARALKIPLDNAATFLERGARAAGLPVDRVNKFLGTKSASDIRSQDIQYIKDQRSQGRSPGTLGEIAGSIIASVPAMMATKNPFALGAIQGALSSEAPDATGVAQDAGAGALLGKVGEVGTRALGALVAPQLSGPVNRLLAKGVRLTPGQIVGGNVKKVEDAATSGFTPFVSSAQHRSYEDANKAVVNDVLAPIKQKLPKDIEAGHDAISFAQDKFDQAYNNVKTNLNIKKDQQFDTDTGNLRQLVGSLPKDYQDMFDAHLKRINKEFEVPGELSGEPIYGISGTMTGHTLKDIEEELGKEVKNYGGKNGTLPTDRKYADAIKELQAQLRDVAMRQNPAYASQLQAINDGYSKLTRVESAAANTKDGIFSPAQFRNAVVQADNSVRHRLSAGGNAHMQNMAKDMEMVLPRQLPDSGTTSRMLVNGVTGATLFGGAAGSHLGININPMYAGTAAALLAPYTKIGGTAFRALIKQRGPRADAARRALQAISPAVGAVNASERIRGRDDNLAGVE